jgi:hypothetical protein
MLWPPLYSGPLHILARNWGRTVNECYGDISPTTLERAHSTESRLVQEHN